MSDSVNVQVIIMKHLCLLFSLTESIYKLLLEQRSEADTGVRTPSGAAVCGFVTGNKGLGAGRPDLGELQNYRPGPSHPVTTRQRDCGPFQWRNDGRGEEEIPEFGGPAPLHFISVSR